jgi:putative cobalt transporter subunit CbtB
MTHPAALPAPITAPALPTIPLRELAPFLLFGGLIAALLLFFVGAEQGAVSIFSGETLHEFVHDARHLLAFPCH